MNPSSWALSLVSLLLYVFEYTRKRSRLPTGRYALELEIRDDISKNVLVTETSALTQSQIQTYFK
jgi:hypothetical protein